MAIKKCRECGGKVSSSAKTCPHCGVSKPYASPSGCFIFIFAVAFATYFTWFKDDEPQKPEDTYEKFVDSQQLRDEAQSLIRANGYTCDKINSIHPAAFGGELTVFCNDIYQFKIKDEGGKYKVTVE